MRIELSFERNWNIYAKVFSFLYCSSIWGALVNFVVAVVLNRPTEHDEPGPFALLLMTLGLTLVSRPIVRGMRAVVSVFGTEGGLEVRERGGSSRVIAWRDVGVPTQTWWQFHYQNRVYWVNVAGENRRVYFYADQYLVDQLNELRTNRS